MVLFCYLYLLLHICPLHAFHPSLPWAIQSFFIPQNMCRMCIKDVLPIILSCIHILKEVYPITLLATCFLIHNLIIFHLVLLEKVKGVNNQNSEHSGLSSGKHYKFFPSLLFSICFMDLEYCILVPLIKNYRMGRDLMKIFTIKLPRMLCLWENTYFSLLTDAAQTTSKQLHVTYRYTPMLHTMHVHMSMYPVVF